MNDATKTCSKCGVCRQLDDFTRDRSNRSGLHTHCKFCKRAAHAQWLAKQDPAEVRAKKLAYFARMDPDLKAQRRETVRIQQKASYHTPEGRRRARADHLKRKYGITLDEYEVMKERQNGLCAICSRPCPTGRDLAVDHDHTTGAVRGLLCANCNRAIGLLQDSANVTRAAAEYLQSWNQTT